MGKYAPFRSFLTEQGREIIPMTFSEIEKVLNLKLPSSKRYPAWWSNNPSNNPMTREWLEVGYATESVDVIGEKVVFRRVRGMSGAGKRTDDANRERSLRGSKVQDRLEAAPGTADDYIVPPRGADPLFGCMAGTLTLLPDVDYTEPADPEWGKVYED